MKYAMICKNRVIDILENQEVEPKWPPDADNNPVTPVVCEEEIEIGMIYDPETNTYSEYIPEPVIEPEYVPTENEIIIDKLTNIESMMTEDREAAINEALDAYTLELMNEGVI